MQKCAHRRLLPLHMAYPGTISKPSFLQVTQALSLSLVFFNLFLLFSGSTFVYPTTTTSQLCSYPLFSPLSPRSYGVPTTTTTISQHLFLLLLYLLLQPTVSCTPYFTPQFSLLPFSKVYFNTPHRLCQAVPFVRGRTIRWYKSFAN